MYRPFFTIVMSVCFTASAIYVGKSNMGLTFVPQDISINVTYLIIGDNMIICVTNMSFSLFKELHTLQIRRNGLCTLHTKRSGNHGAWKHNYWNARWICCRNYCLKPVIYLPTIDDQLCPLFIICHWQSCKRPTRLWPIAVLDSHAALDEGAKLYHWWHQMLDPLLSTRGIVDGYHQPGYLWVSKWCVLLTIN